MRVRAATALALVATTWIPGVAGADLAAPRAHASLATVPSPPVAHVPAELRFTITDAGGRTVRFLQFVHERPMHVVVVSPDLAEFAHIHPQLDLDDRYTVTHTFPHGGRWRVFADYTPPGAGMQVDAFDVNVAGPGAPAQPLVPDTAFERALDSLHVALRFERAPHAGEDVRWSVSLTDAAGRPVDDLQLYLGALAHVMIVGDDLATFLHAHPQETGDVAESATSVHVHDSAQLLRVLRGPTPATLRFVSSFPHAGLYKLWVQLQRHGRVITAPFTIRVAAPAVVPVATGAPLPADAVPILVDGSGFTPARIEVPRGRRIVLAFSRPRGGNCADELVIPALGLRRALPVGAITRVELAARDSSDVAFRCGTGMDQGLIVVR